MILWTNFLLHIWVYIGYILNKHSVQYFLDFFLVLVEVSEFQMSDSKKKTGYFDMSWNSPNLSEISPQREIFFFFKKVLAPL